MELELGRSCDTAFGNPDFVAYAESFGARGYRIEAADQLLPTLQEALARRHGLGDRLPGRLLGEPTAHRCARRARRVAVVARRYAVTRSAPARCADRSCPALSSAAAASSRIGE